MKQHTPPKNPFTLIELLVVVAIIAVLASMLLPALSKARHRSQEVSCSNRLNQIGKAMFLYADEHDGWPVYLLWHSDPRYSNIEYSKWGRHMAPYLGIDWELSETYPEPGSDALFCPLARQRSRSGATKKHELAAYGPNDNRTNSKVGDSVVRISGIESPTRVYYSGDFAFDAAGNLSNIQDTPWNGFTMRTWGSDTRWSWLRHKNAMNVLFFDGHVKRHQATFLAAGGAVPDGVEP